MQKEKKYILKQLPVKEMECLRTNKHEMKNIKMGADEEWTLCDKKEVLELDISYPIEKIHAQTFGIKISTGKNRQFEIVFCKEKQCCFVDRTTAGVNPHDKFAGKYKAPVDFTQEFLTIKLLMDKGLSDVKTITKTQYEQVLKTYPVITELYAAIKEFYEILYSRRDERLETWLEKIENFNIPELQTYVNGIRIDINAVKNGIKLKYNNGLAEGSVNKIKVIKRIMYGRNSFDLLKAKVLLHEHFRCEFN